MLIKIKDKECSFRKCFPVANFICYRKILRALFNYSWLVVCKAIDQNREDSTDIVDPI